jgi:hypothetical protein
MRWQFPLKDYKVIGLTEDSMSFQNIDISKEIEIPTGEHVGAFGAQRRYDVHKGIDLYCPVNTPVYAVEPGFIVQIRPFAGERAGCPWWHDTEAVSVVGDQGLVVYGEIIPHWKHKIGDLIQAGDLIGWVKRVLKNDKGRPTSMLHLELHDHAFPNTGDWIKFEDRPEGLKDPINLLYNSLYDRDDNRGRFGERLIASMQEGLDAERRNRK